MYMANGVLGIIACPMLDDNLVHSLRKDDEPRDITIIDNEHDGSFRRKLDRAGIAYRTISMDEVMSGGYEPVQDRFNLLVLMIDLGLHSKPDLLKERVEGLTMDMQPFVDAIGFYLGTCGNFGWDIPAWCSGKGLKPSAMFCDAEGNLCHDCVGVNIAGGPRYLELQKEYTGHLYIFPAMASNYDDFMRADQADMAAVEENLTDEMREEMGIEPGIDGYMRWLLSLGNYQNILRIDTGIEDQDFDEEIQVISRRTGLNIKVAPPGWASLQPTDDLYSRCKSFLGN